MQTTLERRIMVDCGRFLSSAPTVLVALVVKTFFVLPGDWRWIRPTPAPLYPGVDTCLK